MNVQHHEGQRDRVVSNGTASLRSLLYVPGNQERKLRHAFDFGADAVLLELEDAVPLTQKREARNLITEFIRSAAAEKERTGTALAVRINGWGTGEAEADLAAIVWPQLDVVKVTKIRDASDVSRIDGVITYLERERGIEPGSIRLLPEIDSAYGVLELAAIVRASARIEGVQGGGGTDFANDLGVQVTRNRSESQWATNYVVLASRRLGLHKPLHGNGGSLNDPEHREAVLRAVRALGYGGASCIHPSQVAITNEIFSVTTAETEWALRVMEGYAEAEASGLGTAVVDGTFIDEAHVRWARGALAHAGRE